jgi:hypothetical protein
MIRTGLMWLLAGGTCLLGALLLRLTRRVARLERITAREYAECSFYYRVPTLEDVLNDPCISPREKERILRERERLTTRKDRTP